MRCGGNHIEKLNQLLFILFKQGSGVKLQKDIKNSLGNVAEGKAEKLNKCCKYYTTL